MTVTLDFTSILLLAVAVITSYLIGCLNIAYYLTKYVLKKDIREECSHTAGATNAGRVLGTSGFLTVLALDVLRGYLGVKLGNAITGTEYFSALFVFFIVLGHIFPIQLSWRGGKGAASVIGGVGAISYQLGVIFIALFALLYLVTKRKTSSGLITFATFPVGCYLSKLTLLTTITLSTTMLLIIFRYYQKQQYDSIKIRH